MFICQQCGGQNGLHFSNCVHATARPRVHAYPAPSAAKPPHVHSPTGRMSMEYPQIQNLPGTLAHAIEMSEAKYGPFGNATSGNFIGNMQAGDPSEPHRCMARMEEPMTDEMKLVALLGPKLDTPFTHRDKGGRYKLLYTPLPAGEVMRKVGDTVVYSSLDNQGVYVRDLKDFVACMQPILLSDS